MCIPYNVVCNRKGCFKAKGFLNQINIIINCFGNAGYTDFQFPFSDFFLYSMCSPQSTVSTYTKKYIDIHNFKSINHLLNILMSSRRSEKGTACKVNVINHRGCKFNNWMVIG